MEKITKKSKSFCPKPEWYGEEKSQAGAVAEQGQLIKLSRASQLPVCLSTGGFIEEFFGEDILSDEDDSATECAKDAGKISGELNRT